MDMSAASEPARAAEAPAPTSAAEAPEPPCAADAPTPPSIAAAPSFGSAALVGSGSSTAKASTKTAAPTQKKAKRKGRPPKAKGAEALEWSEAMIASLMRLRFATFCAKFQSARNNAMIRAAWLLLAGELSKDGTGMQGDSLADNDNVGSLFDSDSEDDNGNTGGRKRGKTVAEGLEPQHMEQFMEARFNSVIEQLQVQNQNLAALVELLRKD
ncbi:hypothetical protein PF001_g29730 [Phytophthora fragariae]|uniref:Uncharacterized protein n=1 Tax=Phytophthora fragariae TaxID=53985 RepID=A0A6A4B7Q4_9STRA|nr:hypothetical protein PF001_g29730 [Phytophthora fragariae]